MATSQQSFLKVGIVKLFSKASHCTNIGWANIVKLKCNGENFDMQSELNYILPV
jgi:hypothetical protein